MERSTYSRGDVKRRLFVGGLKEKRCELCGQDENWRGNRMALILDHINGIPDDHRLDNLRIVCPNCAATFATHCGRKNRRPARHLAVGRKYGVSDNAIRKWVRSYENEIERQRRDRLGDEEEEK